MTFSEMSPEKNQIKMYGCTEEQITEGIMGHPLMYAAGILSDAQEVMARGDTETARKFINKAKFIMFGEIEKG